MDRRFHAFLSLILINLLWVIAAVVDKPNSSGKVPTLSKFHFNDPGNLDDTSSHQSIAILTKLSISKNPKSIFQLPKLQSELFYLQSSAN